MQELPKRRVSALAGHAGLAALSLLVEAANQGRQHIGIFGVVVAARAIQISGHQADGIKAVLHPQCLTQLNAGDFGDRIPLVRGL